jgi:hypothetical protein
MEAIDSDAALLQGDVIGPRGSLMDGSDLAALYVTIPVCFPDEFHSCPVSFDEPVVLVWLVPISSAEAAFVGDQGWNAFEEQLAALDPDLWDFDRPSIIPG